MASAPSGGTPANRPEDGRRRLRPQPWWLTFLVVMVANWVLMRALAPEPSYVNIPYTLFKEQVQADNVEEVTSQGDAIQGSFAPHDDGLPPAFQRQPYSEATAELIDAEVRRIVEECQGEATRLLAAHRDQLVALATALLKAESLDEREILEVTGLGSPAARAAGA